MIVAVAGLTLLTTCAVQGLLPPDDLPPLTGRDDDAGDGEPTEEEPDEGPDGPSVVELAPEELRAASDTGTLTVPAAVAAAFDHAEQVVVVAEDDPGLAAVAAPLAVAEGAPLLLGDADDLGAVLAELGEPEIRELTRDGAAPADADEEAPGDPAALTEVALRIAEELGRERFVAAPADQASLLAAAAAVATRTDAAVLPLATDAPAPDLPDGAEVTTFGDLTAPLPDAAPAEAAWPVDGDAATAWVVDPASAAAAPTVALAALRGDTVVPVSDGDLLARRTVHRVRSAGLTAAQLLPVGPFAGDPTREVPLLAEAPLLPGGTLRHFDGTRMVAVYGHPGSTALGVLGEQDLDATVDLVRAVGEGYDADGREVVPTFEIIVTIASREAGDDGDYSRVTPPEAFREWVDRAAEEDIQVILDLQPGRTDFLTQAQLYEDLLREPHVGLALDPEWRLEPDQVHLAQIGRVEAAEVQRVVDWLAELTREEGLTEKLLVLHQFRLSMLQDRDTIEVPSEIAAVVHADGQGPQADKLATWQALTAGAEDRWLWGWKNFYDEDPVVAEPGYVLDLEPEVVLVTFQ